jgi:aldehyde dehydrogenase (NAD+)
MIIFDSSDLDSAADTLVASFNSTTTSSAWRISYVLVQESVSERFFAMLEQKLQPYDAVFAKNENYVEQYQSALNTATKHGFKLIQSKNDKHAMKPTFVFGSLQECLPLVGIDTFRTASEATKLANDKLKGESITMWTEEISLAYEMVENLKCHTVWVNCYCVFDPAVPFTTVSTVGSEKEIIERYTDIWVDQT